MKNQVLENTVVQTVNGVLDWIIVVTDYLHVEVVEKVNIQDTIDAKSSHRFELMTIMNGVSCTSNYDSIKTNDINKINGWY